MKILHSFKNNAKRFFTAPISAAPLGLFRIFIAAFVLVQALLWFPDWLAFFGQDAWVQWEVSRALNQPWHIHMEGIYNLFAPFGFSPDTVCYIVYGTYVTSALGLLLGWYTRIWAVLVYLCHYVMMSTLPTFVYGVDIFTHISLFYLMVMPASKAFSLDVLQGRSDPTPTWDSTLAIRVLQIHLCLIYISAGFEKMRYAVWWEGNVLWRAMVQPDFRQHNMEFLAWYPVVSMLLSWFTMFIEAFYFVGVWIKNVRVYWLVGMILLHLGIGMFLGLWLFGIIMILLSLSAFGFDAYTDIKEWRILRWQNSIFPWKRWILFSSARA